MTTRALHNTLTPPSLYLVACCLIGLLLGGAGALAGQAESATAGWLSGVDADWGGHLRGIGTISDIEDDSIYQFADTGTFQDAQAELRLKNRLYFGPRWTLQTHYELVALGGDTLENTRILEGSLSSPPPRLVGLSTAIDDDRRLLSLTRVLIEEDRYLVYHRLDRLNLTYAADRATVRLGRQALTWGDGMVFNPMDLFNPFAPTTVQRDYKTGDDMAHLQLPVTEQGELQLLALPRRDPLSGDLEDGVSSYAAKYHAPAGSAEMDVMVARHYDEMVGGLGASGYLGEAAWRVNGVYTQLSGEGSRDGYFQAVANLDYAWTWGGKNVYGLAELYYNGLGLTGDYAKAADDPDLVERLARGELFTTGRYYLAGQLQVELHPLLQLHATAIANLSDPSGVLQPQVLWDITGDLQAIAGFQWHWGPHGSEYGGYDVTAGDASVAVVPADRVYLWLTYYY